MVLADLPQHLKGLIGQLSGGRDDESTEAIHRSPLFTIQALQNLETVTVH